MFRHLIKDLVAALLYHSGVLALLVRRQFQDRAVVVTYHRVLPRSLRRESMSHESIVVSPELFERHIAILRRHFELLDLDAFNARLAGRDFSGPPQCLITFDDAWQDNYTYAFDTLRRRKAPAVIFVPTDYIGTQRLFWQERLGHLVLRICQQRPDAGEILGRFDWAHLAGLDPALRVEAIKSAVRDIKGKGYDDIERIMRELETMLPGAAGDYGPDGYLSVAQMREMRQHGVRFQSHGVSHRIFTRLEAPELRSELDGSRRWLEEVLDETPTALAYPNGDHDAVAEDQTATAGYALAFTTHSGYVDGDSRPTALRRINLSDGVAGSEARLLMTLLLSSRVP